MTLKIQYRVTDKESGEALSEWTDNIEEAHAWATEPDGQLDCDVAERLMVAGETTVDDLRAFAAVHAGECALGLVWPGMFSCDGWYLEVSDDKLTGGIVEASQQTYNTWRDELLGCLYRTA